MQLSAIVQRHRVLRWLAPVGVLCIGALAANGMFQAEASSELAHTTPAQLLADVNSAEVSGYSGTVLSQFALGLPQLPVLTGPGDGPSFTSLLSGSHTLQVWYGGPQKERVALLGSQDETDLFREGRDVWQWNSEDRVAMHTVLSTDATSSTGGSTLTSDAAAMRPDQLAKQLLGSLDPSTRATVTTGREVADRPTYDLALTPRSSATKIGSARIAVDGQTKLPLRVRVYARGAAAPALDVAFTNIRFGSQAERNFEFSPPPNATVEQATASDPPVSRTTGTGWTTVFAADIGRSAAAKLQRDAVGGTRTAVSGSWGSGRLLESALVSVLITDDGRVFAGAVEPSGLYAAASE